MKNCSTSLVIRKMQIKTTMSYHFISTKMAVKKKEKENMCWLRCKEIGTLLGEKQNGFTSVEKWFGISSKSKIQSYHMTLHFYS